MDLKVPEAELSTALISVKPRIDRLKSNQDRQVQELAQLRHRSAMIMERWYEMTIMGAGECWADWDRRVNLVERTVKRMESAREREDGEI